MPLQDITITASINSLVTQSYGQRTYIASSDDQSFPIETITGSQAGAWPNFVPNTNYTTGLTVNITQSWSESIVTPLGAVPYIHNTMEEFINGEFSGSSYVVSDGNLTDEDCEQFLKVPSTTVRYLEVKYTSTYSDGELTSDSFPAFLALKPSDGEFVIHINSYSDTILPIIPTFRKIDYLKIAKIDSDNNDNTLSLQELTTFIWVDSTAGKVILTIKNITEYPDYFLYEVSSGRYASDFTVSTYNIVLEPYLSSVFKNSDCDVLMNNYSQNDISQYRQRVLYDNGSIIPSNIEQIIDGTAEYAEINDYLYNANANILPRYVGSRQTQAILNKWTPGDIGLGKIPSVTNQQTYFAYFDYLQITTAELLNKSVAHIIYLFDENGNVQTPTLTGSYYSNLIDNFVSDENANIIIEAISGEKIYIGNKKIIRPGVIPRAILYSQTGSGYNVQTNILFGSSDPTADNIPSYFSKYTLISPNQTIGVNNNLVMKFTFTNISSPNISLNPGVNTFEIVSGSNLAQFTFGLYITYQIQYAPGFNFTNNNLQHSHQNVIYLEKSVDNGSSWFEIDRRIVTTFGFIQPNFQNGQIRQTEAIFSTPITPVTGDQYRFKWLNDDDLYRVILHAQTYAAIDSLPPPSNASASLVGNYWYTGSNITTGIPKNIITSPQFGNVYNVNDPITQRFDPDAGYGPCLPFHISKFDQIRFEGDENQTYLITDVDFGYLNFVDSNFDNWSANSPWTSDLFTATSVGGAIGTLSSPAWTEPLQANTIYYVNFTISDFVAPGGISFYGGGGTTFTGSLLDGNGTYSWAFTSSVAETQIRIYSAPTISSTAFFTGSISNITVTGTSGSLNLTLDRDIVDGTDVNSFLIRRLNPHPNYVLLDTLPISGSGFLLAEFATNRLQQNFDSIIIDAKERGLY